MSIPLRALILEDRAADAELVLHALRRAGFEPEWERAETEPDFLAKVRPDLDVILSDYQMPGFDAPRALQLLQQTGYDVPLIVVTGTISEEVAVETLKDGAADYLLKDGLGRLGQAVTKAIGQRKARLEMELAAAALAESEARYRLLISNIADVTWAADRECRLAFVSPNAEKIYGYTAQEMQRQMGEKLTWLDQVHPDDIAQVRERYEALFAANTPFEVEYRLCRKDGQWIWVHARASSTYDAGGLRYACGVSSDITERKILQAQQLQSQKMEAVGRLAGGVAHDFNNLLTAIIGYSQLAIQLLPEGDSARHCVEQIERAGHRAASLTRQVLAFSRQQFLRTRIIDINDSVTDLRELLTRLIGRDFELVTTMCPNLGPVRADPGQLEQVIVSLVVHARDAMPNGGQLVVETTCVDFDGSEPEAPSDLGPGRYVVLSVKDNGSGMDRATQARIFEPFFTSREMGKGPGLGLAAVYGIVKQSAGHISVSSDPGQGTTFRVYLPCIEEAADEHTTSRIEANVHPASIGVRACNKIE
jgi:two-component system cell cycle sensor histidine kinase/response regulator CckA